MIRDLKELGQGMWIGDFRYDEGVRFREEPISPCVTANSGGGLGHIILLVEITKLNEDKTGD